MCISSSFTVPGNITLTLYACIQGGTYTTVGERMTRRSMTCPMPRKALDVHDRQLNFEAIRPADSDFSNLPPGGARQIYTVSLSNNDRDFGTSQTYTLYNSTCFDCSDDDDLVQLVSTLVNCSLLAT